MYIVLTYCNTPTNTPLPLPKVAVTSYEADYQNCIHEKFLKFSRKELCKKSKINGDEFYVYELLLTQWS